MRGLFSMRRGQRRKQGRHCQHGAAREVIALRHDPVLLQRVDELTARLDAYDYAMEEYRAARMAMRPPHLRLVRKA